MGWTGLHRDKGISNKDFFTRELLSQGSGTILECATKGGVFYAAVRANEGKYEGHVWGLVVLMKYDSKDYYNFLYKDMDESMGPYDDDCPKRVLDLLSPPITEYAKEWRERCYEKANRQKVKAGDIIEFDKPVRFTDGTEHSRFHCESLRPSTFTALDGVMTGYLYKLPKRTYETGKVVAHPHA